MKLKIKKYLDNCFAARSLSAIAWGAFLPFLIKCVEADGGAWNELHRYFEFPPKVTKGGWETTHESEILKKWWERKK